MKKEIIYFKIKIKLKMKLKNFPEITIADKTLSLKDVLINNEKYRFEDMDYGEG